MADRALANERVYVDQEGNPFVWNGQEFVPGERQIGQVEEFFRGAAQAPLALNEGLSRLNQAMGLPEYQLTEQSPAQVEQANQQALATGPGSVAGIAGNVAGELGLAAVTAGAGKAVSLGRAAIAEGIAQTVMSKSAEEAALRLGGTALGYGAIPVGQMIAREMSALGKGAGPAARMAGAADEALGTNRSAISAILEKAKSAVANNVEGMRADLGNLGVGGVAKQTRGTNAAGAARAQGKLWDTAAYGDELEDALGIQVSPGMRAALDADRSQAGLATRQWRAEASSDFGRAQIDEVNDAFTNYVARDLGLTGDMSKANLETARAAAGREIGRIEEQAVKSINPPAQEFMEEVAQRLEGLQEVSAGRGWRNEAAGLLAKTDTPEGAKEALRQIGKKVDAAKGQELSSTKQLLSDIEQEIQERVTANMDEATRQAYQEARRKYAVIRTIQENQRIFRKGEFNARTFYNELAKKYAPLREGLDDSEFSRVLEAVANINDPVSKGSATYDRLKANAPLIGVGGGILGMQ